MADPALTPETAPVVGVIVATAGLLLDHVPPLTELLNTVLPPEQMFCPPLNVPALGAAVTVTERVADASGHPPVPVTV